MVRLQLQLQLQLQQQQQLQLRHSRSQARQWPPKVSGQGKARNAKKISVSGHVQHALDLQLVRLLEWGDSLGFV